MTTEVLPSLDLLVLFDDHDETFSTYTIPEATGMTRITTVLVTVLSLAFTPLAAQETNCDGWSTTNVVPFWEAATVYTVSECLNAGADVNARDERYGATPLMFASRGSKNPAVLEALLEAGADVNAKDVVGLHPLVLAVSMNTSPEVVEVLLNAGANVNARTREGYTPLHGRPFPGTGLYLFGNISALSMLLDAGADINARNEDGWTPLHTAAESSNNPVWVTALLDAGANVNARGEYGNTPLHLAASRNENPEVIIALLDAGADGTAVNEDRQTPFDLAKNNEALAGTDAYWALNDARFK